MSPASVCSAAAHPGTSASPDACDSTPQTLDVPNKYFKGTDDEALNAEFVSKVLALEKDFEKRNANPKSWTR